MSTKRNPGEHDYYASAADDEPMFILLGRDKDAPLIVKLWALMRESAVEMGAKPPTDLAQVTEARQCAYQMERWRYNKDLQARKGELESDNRRDNSSR